MEIHIDKDPTLRTLARQEALKERGLYTGALDNWDGSGTEAAQEAFRKLIDPPKPVDVTPVEITEFTVSDDHWLDGATRLDYPQNEPKMSNRRFGIVHFTAGATAKSSVDFWKTSAARGAEAHIIIDRDGTVYQVLPTDRQADHAGSSAWVDPNTGTRYTNLNSCSIGIELANGGNSDSLIRRYSSLPPVVARHQNGGPVENWEAYPKVQLDALERVARALTEKYNLDDWAGHDDIAPDRKNDPGPAFPMVEFREAIGFTKPLAKL